MSRAQIKQYAFGPERRSQRTSFTCGRYCSCFCVSVPFSRMPPPKQDKTKVATKKKSRLGGPRPGAGRPPIQPGRSAVKIRLDSEVISAVDTVAKLRKLDRSRVIEGALRQWLKEDNTVPGA
jgi:Ribbon-helix-helix protein, copG family